MRREARRALVDLGIASLFPNSEPQFDNSIPWIVFDETDPLDDSRNVALINFSPQKEYPFGGRPTLILHCQSGTTDIYIMWQHYLGSNDSILVSHRIGSNDVESSNWELVADNGEVVFSGNSQEFFKG